MDPALEPLQFVAGSDDRVTVLANLSTGASSTRSELRRETGIARSTVDRILGELVDRELVSSVGHRYEVTPLGGFLAPRLHAVFDSIEAVQRLQRLLKRLSDDPDVAFADGIGCEILASTSSDPGAPSRRFGDLLHAASCVRLLVPAAVPLLFEAGSLPGDGKRTFDVVIPRAALEEERAGSTSARRLRDGFASGDVTLFACDREVPHVVGTLDGIAVVTLTDDAGTIRGYVETRDGTVRSRAAAIVEAHRRTASRVPT